MTFTIFCLDYLGKDFCFSYNFNSEFQKSFIFKKCDESFQKAVSKIRVMPK